MRNLELLLKPKSIAIVGASANINSIAGKPLAFLLKHGYMGKLYPVNPKYNYIQGIKCYKDIDSLPERADVAMLIVRADLILNQVKACNEKGITNIVVVSSGFAEIGEFGLQLQEELSNYCNKNNLSLIGPNSQGIISLHEKTALSFSAALERESLLPGNIGFISQSGAFGNSVFSLAQDAGIGFAYNVCTGNEANVTTLDLIEWMINDNHVKLIACYNEGLKDAHQFSELGKLALEKRKPIVWFKTGKSELGKKAASSHTGAISGEDAVFSKLLKQTGMLRVNDIHELFDTVKVFEHERLAQGNRVGIITTSGGTGVMIVDEFAQLGVEITEFSDEVKKQLSNVLPGFASVSNPIDITAQVINEPHLLKLASDVLLKNNAIDVLCISLTMVVGEVAEKIIDTIIEIKEKSKIPVIISWTVNENRVAQYLTKLKESKIPVIATPVRLANSVSKLLEFSNKHSEYLIKNNEKENLLKKINLKTWVGDAPLNEFTLKKALARKGLPVVKEYFVKSAKEALNYCESMNFPIVLKVLSEKILHKTEVGGVILNIRNKDELLESFTKMEKRLSDQGLLSIVDGYLIQEMQLGGIELILSAINRPPFGPVVSVGLGGVLVEIFKDISYRQAPIDKNEAKEMLTELKGKALLQGFRGSVPVNIDELSNIISKFSHIIASITDFEELEMNPLIVKGDEIKVVDALCITKEEN